MGQNNKSNKVPIGLPYVIKQVKDDSSSQARMRDFLKTNPEFMPKLEKRITDLQSHLKNKMVDTSR